MVYLMEQVLQVKVRCAIIHDRRMLIVRHEVDKDERSNIWRIPGGILRFGEKLENAAIRIAKEYTGLDIEIQRLLYDSTFCPTENKQIILINYLCTAKNSQVVVGNKYDEFKWVKKANLLVHVHSAMAQDFRQYKVLEIPEMQGEEEIKR